MGDPLDALRLLLPRVRQAHAKDATPAATPGTWGAEVPVGEGAVDWPAFVEILTGGGFDGELILEREAGTARVDDLRSGAALLRPLLSSPEPPTA